MLLSRYLRRSRKLYAAEHGAALLEFALATPIIMTMGGYGIELANYAIVNTRVSQITLTLADNASRIGSSTGQAAYNVREADINDLLRGAALMGASIALTTNGRITLTSLENIKRAGSSTSSPSTWGYTDHIDDSGNVQRVHWQRCLGKRGQKVGSVEDPGYDSSYPLPATLPVGAGTDRTYANRGVEVPNGFGAPVLNAPAGSAAILVEINYQYRPLFGAMFISARKIHYLASFIVRDQRDLAQIYNPTTYLNTTLARSTCNLYST